MASENRFFSFVPSLGSKKRKDGAVEIGNLEVGEGSLAFCLQACNCYANFIIREDLSLDVIRINFFGNS